MRPQPYYAPPFVPASRLDDPNVRTLDIPGYRQVRSYTCGYACALMVLRYFRADVPGRELYEALGTDRTGTRQTAIVQGLRQLGLSVSLRYDLDFDRLRSTIEAGKPSIGYLDDIEHWVVMYGYGDAPRRIFIADPRTDIPCEHLWDSVAPRLKGFAMVCSDRSRKRPPAEPRRAREPADDQAPQLVFDFDRGIFFG